MWLKFKLQFGQFGDYDCDDEISLQDKLLQRHSWRFQFTLDCSLNLLTTTGWRLSEWLSNDILIEFLPETPKGLFHKHFASDADNSENATTNFFLSCKTVNLIKGGDVECIVKIDRLYASTGRSKQVDVVMNSSI